MRWRKREEHQELFEHGEKMLCAVECRDRWGKVTWDLSVIECDCSNEVVRFTSEEESWAWDWWDVDFWIPYDELVVELPKPSLNDEVRK